jgi:hypothetical protein
VQAPETQYWSVPQLLPFVTLVQLVVLLAGTHVWHVFPPFVAPAA